VPRRLWLILILSMMPQKQLVRTFPKSFLSKMVSKPFEMSVISWTRSWWRFWALPFLVFAQPLRTSFVLLFYSLLTHGQNVRNRNFEACNRRKGSRSNKNLQCSRPNAQDSILNKSIPRQWCRLAGSAIASRLQILRNGLAKNLRRCTPKFFLIAFMAVPLK